MANQRNPADPAKPEPYWMSNRKRRPAKPKAAKPPLEPGMRVDGTPLDPGPPGSDVGSTRAAHDVYS